VRGLLSTASRASSWRSRRTNGISRKTWPPWLRPGRSRGPEKILVDYVSIERTEIQETGEYDLEGLFIRMGHAIDSIGRSGRARHDRVALRGTLERGDPAVRASTPVPVAQGKGGYRRHHGERGDTTITRHGLEEYVADCVIMLDHRVTEQVSTRRARVVKYRGSRHETNEFPFLIGDMGSSSSRHVDGP